MLIYIILFSIILLLTTVMDTKEKNIKKIYIIICFGLMTIIACLRKYTIGIDLEYLYYPIFKSIVNIPWNYLTNLISLEVGYVFFCKLLTSISNNPQILIVITSLLTIPFTGWFIYKYSKDVKTSTLMYILLNIYFMSLNIVRQEIAVSFILLAFHYWITNKKKKSLLFIILATSFHSSAILMLPIFCLYKKKFKKNYFYLVIILIFFFLLFYKPLINIYSNISEALNLNSNKDYATYLENDRFGTGDINLNSISSVILNIIIFLISYYYIVLVNKTKDIQQINLQHFSLIMVTINMIVDIVSLKMVILARLSYYFLPFSLLIIPEVIKISKNSFNRYIIKLMFFTALFIKFIYIFILLADDLYGVMPYQFFWQ